MKKPLISVFMAAYNADRFIAQAIQSVLNQTFVDFELVIVNDGSTDNTVAVIEQFNDPRIKLYHNAENKGLVYTRNRTLELTLGKYIAIMDSDDIALPDRLALQMDFFSENPDYVLCGGHAKVIDEYGNLTGVDFIVPTDKTIELFMLFGNPYVNSTATFLKKTLSDLGGYRDYALAEDYDLFVRMALNHRVGNMDTALAEYRIHDTNISTLQKQKIRVHERKILSNMQTDIGIINNEHLLNIHMALFRGDISAYPLMDYLQLLSCIKTANKETGRYNQKLLERFLLAKWFDVIRLSKAKNAFALFIHPSVFSWQAVTFKQLRKVFKKSIFNRDF